MPNELTALAQSLISIFSKDLGVQLAFDKESVEWLDGYIERIRPSLDAPDIDGLSNSIGAFLGECIIANYGGSWRQSDDGAWGVFLDEKNAIFPLAKARKQLMNGHEDSILSMYTIIPIVFNKIAPCRTSRETSARLEGISFARPGCLLRSITHWVNSNVGCLL